VCEEEAEEEKRTGKAQAGRFAMSARRPYVAFLGLVFLLALWVPTLAQASFGIDVMNVKSSSKDGSANLRAGSHPYEFTVSFVMNQNSEGIPEGSLRDLIVDLPAGFVGNPLAVHSCSGADFEGQIPSCPINTQVGVAEIKVVAFEEPIVTPVYNLTPPLGVPASIGFSAFSENSFQEAALRPSDYGVRVSDITLPTSQQIQSVTETIWGVPAEAGHDGERGSCLDFGGQCPSNSVPEAFLTLPTSCTGLLEANVTVVSVQEPENPQHASAQFPGDGGTPAGVNGCDKPPFEPSIVSQPETAAADSPTGLHFGLKLPQTKLPQGGDPNGTATATAHLKDAVVTLPQGVSVNASAAVGLGSCTLAQIDLGQPGAAQCPDNSKIGSVTVETPLLDHPVPGSVYLAKQGENPFGSFIALYIVVDDPQTGVRIKLPGKVEPDPLTGQLRTVVEQNPQLPFEDFTFDFFGGPTSPLTTPSTCGTYTTTAQLTPWTSPEGATKSPTDSFVVNSAPGGGPCPETEAQMPHAPAFEAGTVDPLAGAYSPFVLKLSRENGSQRLSGLNTTLPPGVTAKFAGVAECSDAQIAQAAARSNPGQGALEKASPSCPAGSQIGTVNVGAGSGSPIYVQGNVYLAGPYKGAPFSLAIITPGIAGPFDIGTVVVRAALYVNEETGQGTVKSDPLPTILQGIPLDVRSVAVQIDRSGYVLNPTSCEVKAITAEAISTTGAIAQLNNRFQVGGCGALGYTPKLSLSLNGATKRSGHPKFKGVLTQPSGQANSRRVVVILPPTEFIDPLRTANPCTRPLFAAGNCPEASVLGKARVFTPLFDKPLEGPVYFRANGGARELPDAVADLHGPVHFVLVGFVDAVHKKGSEISRVRTTFANVPDAPVSKAIFELKGGKKGTLVNSANLCKVPNTATVKMTAQNNRVQNADQRIGTSCKKK
jgi:hypothetical protein